VMSQIAAENEIKIELDLMMEPVEPPEPGEDATEDAGENSDPATA